LKNHGKLAHERNLAPKIIPGIGDLRNCLAPLLPQCGPSHVLVLIVANRVILFLYRIHKKIPSGIGPIFFKECEGDIFFIKKNCEQRNNLLAELTIFLGLLHIDDFRGEISLMGEIRGYKILVGRIISIEGYKRI
jgi:hypothetical protein